jgi:hypothetical protein
MNAFRRRWITRRKGDGGVYACVCGGGRLTHRVCRRERESESERGQGANANGHA